MISRRPDLTLGHTGGEALGDLFYLSAEQITSCETTADSLCLQPKPLVMHVHPHPKDYQSVALIGCHDFSFHPLRALLTMTDVTVFSCLRSISFTAAWLWRVLQNDVFVSTALRCWDGPKCFIYERCDIERSATSLNLQTFPFPLFAETLLRRNDWKCICCLATIAYWTFYQEVLRSTGSVSVVQRHNSL